MTEHGGHGGGESVPGVTEMAEASKPVWEFLGFLILILPLTLMQVPPQTGGSHH